MNILRNMKIRVKLILVFSTIVAMFIAVFTFVFFSLGRIQEGTTDIYTRGLIGIEKLIEADRDAYQSSIAISLAFLHSGSTDKGVIDADFKNIDENLAQIQERFSVFDTLFMDSGYKRTEDFNVFSNNYALLVKMTHDITSLYKSGSLDAARTLYLGTYADVFGKMRGAIDNLTNIMLERVRATVPGKYQYLSFDSFAAFDLLAGNCIQFVLLWFYLVHCHHRTG